MAGQIQDREERRDALVHTVSHDLRLPLTIILGQAQVILRFADRKELVRSSAEAIDEGARRMNAMVQDLVDLARVESGQLELRRQPVNLWSYLTDLLDRARQTIDIRRITVQIQETLPPVAVDPDRLERILLNLLSNALKYSPSDTEVEVNAVASGNEVIVSVADHGKGIAPRISLTSSSDSINQPAAAGQRAWVWACTLPSFS